MKDIKTMSHEEINQLIKQTAFNCRDLIRKEIGDFEGDVQWLLYGRIVSLLFALHYRPAYEAAVKNADKPTKAEG